MINSTPRVRRPPPKLRTKTGCFMCRKRRKKCDEQKPRCTDCSKHNFKCVWPAPSNTTVSSRTAPPSVTAPVLPDVTDTSNQPEDDVEECVPFRDNSTEIGLARSPVFGLPGIKTSLEHHLSLCFTQRFMPTLLRGNAHPAFVDCKPLIVLGAEYSTLMDTFFATTAAHGAFTNPKMKPLAVKYYNSVISSLRMLILNNKVKGDEDWLVLATNFLCLYESISDRDFAQPSAVASHLEGLARILTIRGAIDRKSNYRRTQTLCRTCSESLVYHLTNGALYYSGVDRVADSFDWDDLSVYLEHDIVPGAKPYESSPLLGCSWKLYRACFELVRLSHKVPLSPEGLANGLALELELFEFDDEIRKKITDSADDARLNYLMRQTHLYVLAAQILAFKTLRPETTSRHPRIAELVNAIADIVENIEVTTDCCAYFGWPVAIASCAIRTHPHMFLFCKFFGKMWEKSHHGDVIRIAKVIRIYWKLFRIGETVDDGGDILNVLISGKGLFENPMLRQKALR